MCEWSVFNIWAKHEITKKLCLMWNTCKEYHVESYFHFFFVILTLGRSTWVAAKERFEKLCSDLTSYLIISPTDLYHHHFVSNFFHFAFQISASIYKFACLKYVMVLRVCTVLSVVDNHCFSIMHILWCFQSVWFPVTLLYHLLQSAILCASSSGKLDCNEYPACTVLVYTVHPVELTYIHLLMFSTHHLSLFSSCSSSDYL